ncbi:MAG: ABC transporter ATP-binding protein [Xanthobacteraceae bacterium]
MKLHLQLLINIVRYLRWKFPAMLILMGLVGVTEGLSVSLLLPLFSQIGISYSAGPGLAGSLLHQALSAIGGSFGISSLLVIIVGFAALQAVFFIALHWWMTSASRSYKRGRQSQLFRAIMCAQWEFVSSKKAGELTNAIVSESERLAQSFYIGLYLISTFLGTCIYLALALMIAWPITLALIGSAVVMTLAVLRLYGKSFAVGQSIAPLNAELQSVLSERISGIKIVKATVGEDAACARVNSIVGKLERANAVVNFLPMFVRGLFEFLAFCALAAIFVLGQEHFGVSPGNVIVVFALFMRLFPRITTVQSYLHLLNGFLHAMAAIDELQSAAEAHTERQNGGDEKLSVPLPSQLALRDVAVKFGERNVLEHIDLAMPIPGMIGIVGGSGAGKSTLVHVLLGLVSPSAGSITLGAHNLARVPLRAWRRQVGYVPQETILFHASVRENLMLPRPDATAAEVELAAKRAHAHDFISALPRGYDTIIGDQGVLLSGGQRQRIAIARALLMDPIVLLMDEAMSALDSESEALVLSALKELRGQIGILLIAHRLATVRYADVIAVLHEGRLAECGTWDQLVTRRERLHALIQAQVN